MDEEVAMLFEDAEERLEKTIDHLKSDLSKIRAGKADIHILDGITIDYYGTPTPLSQVSNINTPDAKTIAIQPWEKALIPTIEKAIMEANIGLNPDNNGEIIRLFLPPLTEERRKQYVKQAHQEGETARIAVRSIRHDVLDELKKMQKDGLSEDIVKKKESAMQDLYNVYIKKIDEAISRKEKDIMTI